MRRRSPHEPSAAGEPHAERLELIDLLLAQLGKALRHVLDRFGEPLFNVLGICTDDAATHDVLEQLVAGLFERRRLHGSCVPTCSCISLRLGHVIE